jgi:two-component system, sensor histidine kinase SagS
MSGVAPHTTVRSLGEYRKADRADNGGADLAVTGAEFILPWVRSRVPGGCRVAETSSDAGGGAAAPNRDRDIVDHLPDGVALLDSHGCVEWANRQLEAFCGPASAVGCDLFAALDIGPGDDDAGAVREAVRGGRAAGGTLRTADGRFVNLEVSAAFIAADSGRRAVVAVRDVTRTILEQQKRAAIHAAGQKLADLSPTELADMTVDERIELLKSNILHYSRDLLKFDVVEIRLLDAQTGRLEPLLAEGMQPEAEARILHARSEHNGVTGYVAATGRSYWCSDTTKDPLYLEGCKGAKSSLTVPLMLHDKVIGTFNVESPEPGGFSATDLQFLEIFSRDVAAALNTLELLVAEKASTAAESIEAIHGAVALPVDDILNDAVGVMEKYIGHDADVVERLQRILRNARDIKQVIQKVGETMAPSAAHAQRRQGDRRRGLVGRRILVVDADDQVRAAAHALLERSGCTVETARDGGEAASLVRAGGVDAYDVIIADIRLPDMSGYELLLKLRDIIDSVPLVLMTGFGYDPGHSIVKARQAGIDLVLFKPFRVDQLLDTVEKAAGRHAAARAPA